MKKLPISIRVIGVILSTTLVSLVAINSASAAAPCVVGKANNFTINADNTITASFEVKGDADCTQPVSVMTWNANPSLFPNSEFYTSQTVNAVSTQTFGVGVHTLTVKLPTCVSDPTVVRSYQADVIAGAHPANTITAPGTPGYYWEAQSDGTFRVVDYKIAPGTCPVATVPSVATPVTPAVAAVPVAQPTKLVNTGPGSAIALAMLAVVAGTLGYSAVIRKNLARS